MRAKDNKSVFMLESLGGAYHGFWCAIMISVCQCVNRASTAGAVLSAHAHSLARMLGEQSGPRRHVAESRAPARHLLLLARTCYRWPHGTYLQLIATTPYVRLHPHVMSCLNVRYIPTPSQGCPATSQSDDSTRAGCRQVGRAARQLPQEHRRECALQAAPRRG